MKRRDGSDLSLRRKGDMDLITAEEGKERWI
jgi:hypothetical protein